MADIYQDPRLYDFLCGAMGWEDLTYWSEQCRICGGPVLELACGSGRLTVPLAEQGIEIEGLDLSEGMLAVASENASKHGLAVPWHLAECTDFDLECLYSMIFFPNNSIAHLLHWRDLEKCLACVRRHLAGDGYFLIDYFNPALGVLQRESGIEYTVGEFLHPDDGTRVVVTETNVYDTATQINHIHWHWKFEAGRPEVTSYLPMRVYFPQELDALLSSAGFTIVEKYGSYALSPFTNLSQKQLIVAK